MRQPENIFQHQPRNYGQPESTQTMKKVFIRTFGCQMNEYDSEKMLAVLAEEHGGIEQVSEPDNADIILFNTCSVREKAQEKVFSDLGRVKPLKQKTPSSSSAWPAALPRRKAKPLSNARPMWMSFSGRKPCTACPK